MRSWAAERDEAVARVTLDREERGAQRFWIHLIETLADAAGDQVVERVSPAPRFAGAVVMERLLVQLERLEEPLELVIDDLHELDCEDALAWLEVPVVSANTVRTDMRHIYSDAISDAVRLLGRYLDAQLRIAQLIAYAKLDAHSRSEAVARARELGLVAPGALRR